MRWWITLAGMLAAGTARADRSDELVREGGELARQHAYGAARDKLREADRLRPRTEIACLIALSYLREHRLVEAELELATCHARAATGEPALLSPTAAYGVRDSAQGHRIALLDPCTGGSCPTRSARTLESGPARAAFAAALLAPIKSETDAFLDTVATDPALALTTTRIMPLASTVMDFAIDDVDADPALDLVVLFPGMVAVYPDAVQPNDNGIMQHQPLSVANVPASSLQVVVGDFGTGVRRIYTFGRLAEDTRCFTFSPGALSPCPP